LSRLDPCRSLKMAGADQSFRWWSAGDPQNDTSADSEPSSYPNIHTFNQIENAYQRPYDLHPEQHHDQDGGNNLWLPILDSSNKPGSTMVPLPNGIPGLPRPSFHTAPPHPLPPSQIHGLRKYHTDPQPRDVNPRETATVYSMHFDRAGAVDLNNFMVRLPRYYQEN
jgi:hypothetical protein